MCDPELRAQQQNAMATLAAISNNPMALGMGGMGGMTGLPNIGEEPQ